MSNVQVERSGQGIAWAEDRWSLIVLSAHLRFETDGESGDAVEVEAKSTSQELDDIDETDSDRGDYPFLNQHQGYGVSGYRF